jgi:uncharacterized secreted protein with C-terminal beta-propeller domain
MRKGLALGTAIFLLAGCTGGSGGNTTTFQDPGVPTGTFRLVAFDTCDDLLKGLRGAAKAIVGPYGFNDAMAVDAFSAEGGSAARNDGARGGPAAPNAAAAPGSATKQAPDSGGYSGTNTHEAGVDEPDLVKTDGKRIVTMAGGVLRVVDVARRQVVGSLNLFSGTGNAKRPYYNSAENLLMVGDHVLVLRPTTYAVAEDVVPNQAPQASAMLTLVDISGAPKSLGTYTIEGSMVDARQVGSTVRVVTRSSPTVRFPIPGPAEGNDIDKRVAANREVIDKAPVTAWLPKYTSVDGSGRKTEGRVDCGAVSRPAQYSGTSLVTVLTFDLGRPTLGDGDPVSVVADGDTVYSNGPSLYIANDQRWRARPMMTRTGIVRPAPLPARTELYKFDTSTAAKPKFQAAGAVNGWLLNQYSLSEWDGHLRVATTSENPWDRSAATRSESAVYVLRHDGGELKETGQVGGLGKGERIYSVRFVGGTGYVVTFRQTDPLYTVDLRNPKSPKVMGELKITGYSAYLHPAGDGRLIGIGQEASEQGRVQGTQVSLFDVSDLSAPKRLAQYHMKGARSEAETDPHAFLYWPKTGLLAVPLWTSGQPGLLVLGVRDTAINERGAIAHTGQTPVRRSLVIDETLWTVSDQGIKANDLTTLNPTAWLALS